MESGEPHGMAAWLPSRKRIHISHPKGEGNIIFSQPPLGGDMLVSQDGNGWYMLVDQLRKGSSEVWWMLSPWFSRLHISQVFQGITMELEAQSHLFCHNRVVGNQWMPVIALASNDSMKLHVPGTGHLSCERQYFVTIEVEMTQAVSQLSLQISNKPVWSYAVKTFISIRVICAIITYSLHHFMLWHFPVERLAPSTAWKLDMFHCRCIKSDSAFRITFKFTTWRWGSSPERHWSSSRRREKKGHLGMKRTYFQGWLVPSCCCCCCCCCFCSKLRLGSHFRKTVFTFWEKSQGEAPKFYMAGTELSHAAEINDLHRTWSQNW